jgi:hypothetical protein
MGIDPMNNITIIIKYITIPTIDEWTKEEFVGQGTRKYL